MCETAVLVSTEAPGLFEVVRRDNVANYHEYMVSKCIMGVQPGHLSNSIIAEFGKVDVNKTKHKKNGEVASVPQENVYIKDERF